jgi:deoxyribonuclease V
MISAENLTLIGNSQHRSQVQIPYISGLLGFREAPIMAQTIKRLMSKPDVILVDGHGLAHPRKFGSACHVGVITDTPTIGVAKGRLYGSKAGDLLLDKAGDTIAWILKDMRGKPYYISVGHKITLSDAMTVIKRCMGKYGPEPLRQAHIKSKEVCKNL